MDATETFFTSPTTEPAAKAKSENTDYSRLVGGVGRQNLRAYSFSSTRMASCASRLKGVAETPVARGGSQDELVTPLSTMEQVMALRSVLHNLQIGHVEQAHIQLLEILQQTPADSSFYDAMVEAANWIHPLENLHSAKYVLAEALVAVR